MELATYIGKHYNDGLNKKEQKTRFFNVELKGDEGRSGEHRVSEEVYESLNGLEFGDRVEVHTSMDSFNGRGYFRIKAIKPV